MNTIEVGLFAMAAAVLAVHIGGIIWVCRDRRKEALAMNAKIAGLKVGQVCQCPPRIQDNPFKEFHPFRSRITDIKTNSSGRVWVEFCYVESPTTIKHLPADRFISVYPILSDNE